MANEVVIRVRSSDDGGRGFKNQEKRAHGLKSTVGSLGGTFKAAAGAALGFGALEVFKNSLKGASDLNESMSKVGVVFGKSAGDIHKWSQSAATSMGLSRNAAEEFAGSLGLTFTQMGTTTSEAAKMSKAWVKLAADLGSFNNADPTEILDAMQSATRGEYDELQRYVPSISAAAVEHEALAISGKKSADALSAHDKLLAVQKILFRDTAKAQGDFARTSSGAANSQKILSAQWEDAQAKLGKGLLPILLQTTRTLSKLVDFGTRNKNWLAPTIAGLGVLAASLKAVALAQGLANIAAEANPYIRIATIILAVGTAFVVAYNKSQTFRNIMIDTAATTAQAFIRVGEVITNVLLGAFNAVVQGAAKAFGWLPGVGKRIKQSAKEISDWKNSVVGSFDHASDAVEDWSTNLKNAPKVAKLKGDIKDLEEKIARGKAQLKSVPPSKRSALLANIHDLERKVASAKRQLASIRNKTAYIDAYVRVHQKRVNIGGGQSVLVGSGRYAHGGITAQGGGPRSRQVLVGEQGEELVDLPSGSMVHSNADTRRILGQQQRGGGGQPAVINIVLDGKVLAQLLFDPLKGVVRQRGGKGSNSAQKAWGF
jgi:hypothetical protein